MENINNNFDERLKKYSEKIKSMEIVYCDGRVKCINNKNIIFLFIYNILFFIRNKLLYYNNIDKYIKLYISYKIVNKILKIVYNK